MSAAKRIGKYFTGAGYLILSAAVFFFGENSTWAEESTKPATEPHIYNRDLRTLPPPPPETRTSPPKRINPEAPVTRPLPPGPADPLWKPDKKSGSDRPG